MYSTDFRILNIRTSLVATFLVSLHSMTIIWDTFMYHVRRLPFISNILELKSNFSKDNPTILNNILGVNKTFPITFVESKLQGHQKCW